MRTVVYGGAVRLIAWAESRIPGCRFSADAKAIGLERDGELAAAVVYDNFRTRDCLMHVASDGSANWLNREFIVRAAAFPFLQCGFARVTCMIESTNLRSLRFAEKLGCVREGVLREAAPSGADYIVLGLLRRECHWLAGITSANPT